MLCCDVMFLLRCFIFWHWFFPHFLRLFFFLFLFGLHKFAIARFRFVWHRCLFFFHFTCIWTLYRTANPLACHNFPPVSSLTPSVILANYVMFCCPWSHLQNMSWSPIFASFLLGFLLPHANTSHRTHVNPWSPIQSRLCSFCFCFAKHDVRGNFPDHRAEIRVCETIISPPLPCFCVPRVPYTPSHP